MDTLIGNVISAVQADASYDQDLKTAEHSVQVGIICFHHFASGLYIATYNPSRTESAIFNCR